MRRGVIVSASIRRNIGSIAIVVAMVLTVVAIVALMIGQAGPEGGSAAVRELAERIREQAR